MMESLKDILDQAKKSPSYYCFGRPQTKNKNKDDNSQYQSNKTSPNSASFDLIAVRFVDKNATLM